MVFLLFTLHVGLLYIWTTFIILWLSSFKVNLYIHPRNILSSFLSLKRIAPLVSHILHPLFYVRWLIVFLKCLPLDLWHCYPSQSQCIKVLLLKVKSSLIALLWLQNSLIVYPKKILLMMSCLRSTWLKPLME